MPSVQNYKTFVNSLDFEKIYKESLPILNKLYPNISDFYKRYTYPCINNETVKLLYNEQKIIGYVLYSIKKRILKFHFYYITPKNRNRIHGRFFREQIFEQLKNDVDSLETSINKTNFAALNAARKTAEKLKLDFLLKKIENPQYICKQYVCEIKKKPLDNLEDVCDSNRE